MDTQMILFYYIILGFVDFRCPTNDVRGKCGGLLLSIYTDPFL